MENFLQPAWIVDIANVEKKRETTDRQKERKQVSKKERKKVRKKKEKKEKQVGRQFCYSGTVWFA